MSSATGKMSFDADSLALSSPFTRQITSRSPYGTPVSILSERGRKVSWDFPLVHSPPSSLSRMRSVTSFSTVTPAT